MQPEGGGTPRHASLTCADLISCRFSQENTRAAERPESAAIDKPMLAERRRQRERPQTTVCVCRSDSSDYVCAPAFIVFIVFVYLLMFFRYFCSKSLNFITVYSDVLRGRRASTNKLKVSSLYHCINDNHTQTTCSNPTLKNRRHFTECRKS